MRPVALKFGKTEGEIWMERLTAGLTAGVILLAHAVLFVFLTYKTDKRLAAALSPVLCWFVWQSVSKVTTDGGFSVRFLTDDKTAREVWDILFTACAFINCALCLYFALNL